MLAKYHSKAIHSNTSYIAIHHQCNDGEKCEEGWKEVKSCTVRHGCSPADKPILRVRTADPGEDLKAHENYKA